MTKGIVSLITQLTLSLKLERYNFFVDLFLHSSVC